jgi:hypothetical protein
MNSGICVKACPEKGAILTTDDVFGKTLIGTSGTAAYASRDLLNICMPIADELKAHDPEAWN